MSRILNLSSITREAGAKAPRTSMVSDSEDETFSTGLCSGEVIHVKINTDI